MSRAVSWALIVALVVLIGTHPSSMAGLVHSALGGIQRAGSELSAFVSKL